MKCATYQCATNNSNIPSFLYTYDNQSLFFNNGAKNECCALCATCEINYINTLHILHISSLVDIILSK